MLNIIIGLSCFIIGLAFGRYVNKLDRLGDEARKKRKETNN